MVMKTTAIDNKEIKEILNKKFINRSEFKKLVGIESHRGSEMFNLFRTRIKKELDENGLILPDTKHLPLDLVLKYLTFYGITYKR